jgi:predicted outer membrane protein
MRRALAAAALAALVLAGCGESDEPTTAEQPAASETPASDSPSATEEPTEETSSPATAAIEIEIDGDSIEPNGMRVKVAAGEPVNLEVESDRPAELHVHSSPEQVLEVEKGESMLTLTIERPGIVDVEEHETGKIVLQLEVR